MPKSRKNRWGRGILMALMSFWIIPVLFLGWRASGVSAQGTSGAIPPTEAGKMAEPSAAAGQRVIVLDYTVSPGLDTGIGRRAADAMAVSLGRAGYDVVPKQQVMQAIANMPGALQPLDRQLQLQLARDLNATSVFTGTVHEAKTEKGTRAQVLMDTLQLDALSAVDVNGARVTGVANALTSPGPDVLLDEAINRAADDAVRQMRLIKVVKGTILVSGVLGEATINVGARAGVKVGDRFAVTHRSFDRATNAFTTQRVGEIKVNSVESFQSTAAVLSQPGGIDVQDSVTRVFELPAFGAGLVIRGSRARSGLNALALPVVALGLLVGAIGSGGDQSSQPAGITASAGSTPGTVLVTVTKNNGVFSDKDVAGFILYRQANAPVLSVSTSTFRDFGLCVPIPFRYIDTTQNNVNGAGQQAGGGGAGNVTATFAMDDGGNCLQSSGQQQGGGGAGQQGGAPTPLTRTFTAPIALSNGTSFFYNVTQVTRIQNPIPPATGQQQGGQQGGGGLGGGGLGGGGLGGGGLGGGGLGGGGLGGGIGRQPRNSKARLQGQGQQVDGGVLVESNANPSGTGAATPLANVTMQSPSNGAQNVTLNRVLFQWTPVTGADTYQIQVSTDSLFSAGSLATANGTAIPETFSTFSGNQPVTQTLTNLFVPNATENSTVFWRVGARNSRDGIRPQSLGSTNDNGYVFPNNPPFFTFALAPTPPGVPALNRKLTPRARINHIIEVKNQGRGSLLQRMLRQKKIQSPATPER